MVWTSLHRRIDTPSTSPERTGHTMVTRRSMKKVTKVQQMKMMVVRMITSMWDTSHGTRYLALGGLEPK